MMGRVLRWEFRPRGLGERQPVALFRSRLVQRSSWYLVRWVQCIVTVGGRSGDVDPPCGVDLSRAMVDEDMTVDGFGDSPAVSAVTCASVFSYRVEITLCKA